jgi:hypothetical protein
MKRTILLLACALQLGWGQTVHRLPFASQGNELELAVANVSRSSLSQITIRLTNAPSWLRFEKTEQTLSSLDAEQEQTVTFRFSLERSAPVQQPTTLHYLLTTPEGASWSKQVKIEVNAPETCELFQNYPNPFNPTTTISYQLPVEGRVVLVVYNLLGQKIVTLDEGEKRAGFHRAEFDGRSLASGVYVYELQTVDPQGHRFVARKAMVLLR